MESGLSKQSSREYGYHSPELALFYDNSFM